MMSHHQGIRILAKGKYLSLVKRSEYEFVKRSRGSGVVVIFPLTNKNQVVLVEQYRVPIDNDCIELCAGLVGDEKVFLDETMISAAKRELLEETGFIAKSIKLLSSFPTSSGMSSETVHLYYAKGLKRVHSGGGDKTEKIRVHLVPLEQIRSWLKLKSKKGKAIDYKIYAALGFLGL